MSISTMKRLMIFIGIAFLLTIPIGVNAVNARNAGDADLAAVWQRVQESGAYGFSADIAQRNTPQATVLNAGRKATRHAYYLEGDTDIRAETLHLMLWTGGGSVQAPNSGTEMLIEGDQARARQGTGSWEEVDDFTGLFAPGGDFLAYTQAAQNVVRHAPEMRSTPLGEISITRYTFDINGRKLAIRMHEQMRDQAMREGLPANVSMDLPRVYAEMTGTGELWVGADGLPLRQILALEFPPDADEYVSTADVTVDFSDFAPLTAAGGLGMLGSQLVSSLQAVGNLQNALSLLAAALALWLMALVVLGRRSKHVYGAVVIAVVCSMLVTPLLTSRQVSAYSARQEERRAAQEELQGRQEVQETVQERMRTAAMNPHADPLAAAQAAAVAAPMLQSTSDGRYFDPSCETDPTGDIDGDGLTNLSECLLGTLPDVADTDNDGVADAVEVTGFSYRNQTWYTDPANADSNNDGISDGKEWYLNGSIAPPDTDGDGTPDLWDDDNDDDGVRDSLDLSPYASTSRANAFSGANPFELTINDLMQSELVRVEFQIRPTESSHLWYSQSVLDWPQGDQQAQIQDVDGKTFADLDPTLPAWPNANGDMRLTPMLEIAMDAATANLPSEPCTDADGNPDTCYPLLQQFGISVQQTDDNTLTAYVPLQVVSDNVGDDNVAFYARMFYQAGANWGAANQVRVSWVVQMLNDVCGYPATPPAGYPANTVWPPDPDQPPADWNADEYGAWPAQYSLFQNGLCQFYSSMNELQVLHTYDEAWYLTGMHVMEEHSADIALIYEDPSVTGSVGAGYDSPLYLDTLYGLLYGLNSTFLAARDCDSTDAGGNCQGNGQLDITVDTIGDRFNHATNGYSADNPIYWGLPNVLSVVKNGVERAPGDGRSSYTDIPTYEAIDLGMLDTTTVQTMHVLTSTFDAAWSTSDPITPTIMMASQQSYRDLNLDRFISNDPNISWNSNSLTLNLPQSGDNAVEVDTLATVKWTPYAYDPATGWAAADINDYYNELSTLLVDSFSGITDPDEAQTQQTMAQLLYLSAYGGDANVVQIGDTIPDYGYQQPDEPIYISLTAKTLTYLATAVDKFYTYTAELAAIVKTYTGAGTNEVVSKFLDVKIFSQLQGWKGIAAGIGGALVLALFATDAIVNYLLGDSNTKLGIGLNDAVQSVFILYTAYDIYTKVAKVVQLTIAASRDGTASALVDAFSETLTESSTVLDASKFLGVVGLVIAIGVAVGMFIYAWAKGDISPGSAAFNEALAATIAAVIVAIVLFVLALTVVGLLIVLLVGLIDTILKLAGAKFTITGWITTYLAGIIYQYDLETTQDVETGQLDIGLVEPDLGMTAANSLRTTLPLTTTLYETPPSSPSFYSGPVSLVRNSMVYELSTASDSLATSLGARNWDDVSYYKTWVDAWGVYELFKVTATDNLSIATPLIAGLNASTPLWLNSAYALLADSCWVGFCQQKTVSGSSSDSLGTIAVLDVLPATLDEFVAVSDWGPLTFLDADGDGMLSHRDGGLDPDDSTADIDQDGLSDAYEVTIRSLPSDQGGVALRSDSGDSDSDNIPDSVEMRWGMDPGNRDSDGDGLLDEQELAPGGGWLIAYAYDETTGVTSETRIWSDPNRADGDGDGMSDLFEQDQDILQVDPFADPADPRVYNPNVWNESPVALYIDDNTTDGFIKPGATVVYTTTTANNLSSGQELVGQLSLSLPTGVTGAPISQTVDIASGASSSLVSALQFAGSGTAQYTISSLMSLTDFDQTRWSWDESDGSSRNGLNGTPQAVAITPVDGWEASYLVAALERATNGNEAISTYVVRGDGTVEQANTQLFPQSASVLNSPDVACNSAGVCALLWGSNSSGQNSGYIAGFHLDNGPQSQTTIVPFANGEAIRNLSVATDGANFMVAWAASNSNNTQTVVRVTSIGANGSVGNTQTVATVNGAAGGAAIDWTGSSYTVVWTGDGNVHRANVNTSGAVSNAGVIAAGAAWPQSNGGVHPPSIAYDAVSGQSLVAYRSPSDELAARQVGSGISDEITITASGVSGDNVSVAISPDTENSGWVVAWVPAAGGMTAFSAISPLGAVRTDVSSVDKLTLTAVALACIQPEYELILEFNDAEGARTFADSSGNMNDAFCQTTASCPRAGVPGKFGSAVSFDGSDDLLRVTGSIARSSFTVAAWVKRDTTGGYMFIASQGEGTHNAEGTAFLFGFQDDNRVFCNFWDDTPTTTSKAYADLLWHHYACTYDEKSKKRTIYVDGQPAAASTARVTYQNQGDFVIGQDSAALDFDNYLHGEMDNLLVVNRALSAAEMVDVFETPMAVFDLDEAPGSQRFINGVDGGTDGVCSGNACPAMGVAGKAFTAARFDGDDVITIPGTSSIPLKNSSFTLSAWAKSDGANHLQYLISQGPGAGNQGLRFGFEDNSQVYCIFWDNDLRVDITLDTDWHNWVCTYDVTTRQRTIYRDGVQIGQDIASANYAGEGDTYIGGPNFEGVIDEVGIFPEALSADAVKQIYQKVKIQDASTLTCQLPLAESDGKVAFGVLTLRETTTRLGDINQTVTRTVTVDNDNPIVTIRTLDNNQYVSPSDADGGMVSVSGVATDTTSYIAGVQVQTDGGAWNDASGTEAWAYNWDATGRPEGKHTVTAQAIDAVGNTSDGQSVSFILDRTAPTIWAVSTVQPTQNAAGQWYMPLIGNVSDPNAGSEPGSGVAAVEVLLQGMQETTGNGWQTATLSGDTWTLDYILPRIGDNRQVIADPSGVYTVTLRATDAVSNTTPADAYPTNVFPYDVTAPALTVNLPLSVTQVISTELMVNGSVQDATGVATVEVNLTPAEQIGALDGNVLHLPMDETRASAYFDDQSGSNHDATCTGGGCPTVGEVGQRDGAFGFDGTDDFLNAGDAIAELAQADFSIGAWVKTTGAQVAIVTKSNGDNTWQTGEKSFYLDGAGVPNFVGWGDSYIRGSTAVNDGAWHHVLVTWDYSGSGAAGTGKIYVDGTDDTASTTNYEALHADNAGDTLKIGRPNYGNEAPKFFAGLLDEVIVYDRALADYEAANLYAYGQVTWQPATVANGTWSYTIPEGENGVEGLYQINVRGTDTLGNTTPLSGQRGWRGEIDTRSPSVEFVVTTNESGSTPSTTYECIVTDFNLLQESDSNGYQTTSCVPGFANVPFYKNSDLTLTTYADADPWYAATITDTARLYGMDAVRTYAGGPADDLNVTACDLYNRCTTALPELRVADPLPSAAAEILAPPSGTVLTVTAPISISGDVYADNGLRALRVLNNGTTVHLRNWETPDVMSELWEFTWTPPGEGIYRFTTIIDDWTGIRPPEPAGAAPDEPAVTDAEGGSMPEMPDGITPQAYLPWISAMDTSGGIAYYLPLIAKAVQPASNITGTVTTLYVDLTPPDVVIESTLLTAEHALGPLIMELSGTASDATALHRVDVRIGDGPWQRAGLDSAGRWRFPWRLDAPPADQGYQVSARATDLAGRTTIVTATVIVSAQ